MQIYGAVTSLLKLAGAFANPTTLTARVATGLTLMAAEGAYAKGENAMVEAFRNEAICDINQTLAGLSKILSISQATMVSDILRNKTDSEAIRLIKCEAFLEGQIHMIYTNARLLKSEERDRAHDQRDLDHDREIRNLKQQHNREIQSLRDEMNRKFEQMLKSQGANIKQKRRESMRAVNAWVRGYV